MTHTGEFNERFSPIVRIEAAPLGQNLRPIDFLLDTGFNGHVTIRSDMYAEHEIVPVTTGQFNTVTGEADFDVCLFKVKIDEVREDVVEAVICDVHAVGTEMLRGFRLEMDFVDHGSFSLAPI